MSSIFDGEDNVASVIWVLTSIGSLNWGLVEFFDVNIVTELGAALGSSGIPTAIYAGVGVAGAVTLADHLGAYDVQDFSEMFGGN
jgi:uncharacterized membrane protein YuzA (DUF378 family)